MEGEPAPALLDPSSNRLLLLLRRPDIARVGDEELGRGDGVEISEVLRVTPIRMHVVPGFTTQVFPFTTDVPFLDRWGTPLLYGPGSFLVAHTDGEFVALDELLAAVDGFERLARECLKN